MRVRIWAVAAALALAAAGCSAIGDATQTVTQAVSRTVSEVWNGDEEPAAEGEQPLTPTQNSMPAFVNAPLTPAALMAHVERLSSDRFEGRAPGSPGETLTINYISRAFRAAGLQPGVPGVNGGRPGWLQDVPINTSRVTNNPVLSIGRTRYAYGTDFVAWTKRVQPRVSLQNAELVFVGYGVVAPENHWNDYAGVDMRGKVAVILINDPDFDTGDDRGFAGRAMTYYGRWMYKFEEAARRGAAGALIIHENEAAAYPWPVVQSSWAGAQHDIVRPDAGASRMSVEGWIQNSMAQALFTRAGLDLAAERTRAQSRGFTPVSLRASASIAIDTEFVSAMSHNVIGVLPGGAHPEEAVIYGAHWDHLGHCTPVDGDDICNGALDNATGVAGLIELARRFSDDARPARSAVFIAFTAEESGLLGSAHYAQHPVFAPARTVAMINMDGLSISGPTRDIIVVGYGQSDLDQMLREAAAAQGRVIAPEANPERGSFYRSDHFNLAKVGVPVLYTGAGLDLFDGGVERGRQISDAYIANRYHKPDDEITPDWDMTGAMRDLQLLYVVGHRIADSAEWPQWAQTSEFRAVREASQARAH